MVPTKECPSNSRNTVIAPKLVYKHIDSYRDRYIPTTQSPQVQANCAKACHISETLDGPEMRVPYTSKCSGCCGRTTSRSLPTALSLVARCMGRLFSEHMKAASSTKSKNKRQKKKEKRKKILNNMLKNKTENSAAGSALRYVTDAFSHK